MKTWATVEKRGLIHVDGKKEFAFDSKRNVMVVNVYGTADEDRFWDKAKYLEGEFVDLTRSTSGSTTKTATKITAMRLGSGRS